MYSPYISPKNETGDGSLSHFFKNKTENRPLSYPENRPLSYPFPVLPAAAAIQPHRILS